MCGVLIDVPCMYSLAVSQLIYVWCINRRTLAGLHVLLGCFTADLCPVTSIIGSSGIVTYLVVTNVGSAAILQRGVN